MGTLDENRRTKKKAFVRRYIYQTRALLLLAPCLSSDGLLQSQTNYKAPKISSDTISEQNSIMKIKHVTYRACRTPSPPPWRRRFSIMDGLKMRIPALKSRRSLSVDYASVEGEDGDGGEREGLLEEIRAEEKVRKGKEEVKSLAMRSLKRKKKFCFSEDRDEDKEKGIGNGNGLEMSLVNGARPNLKEDGLLERGCRLHPPVSSAVTQSTTTSKPKVVEQLQPKAGRSKTPGPGAVPKFKSSRDVVKEYVASGADMLDEKRKEIFG